MPIDEEPIVTQWYRYLDSGREFQVIAIDQVENTVEIRYFDGNEEETETTDLDGWYELEIEPIPPPEEREGLGEIERGGYEGAEPEEDEEE